MFLKERKSSEANLSMKEHILKRSNVQALDREWQAVSRDGYTYSEDQEASPFTKLLDAADNVAFLEAYNALDNFLENENIKLIGVSIKYKTDHQDKFSHAFFSAPTKANTNGAILKFEIDEAILYLMKVGEK